MKAEKSLVIFPALTWLQPPKQLQVLVILQPQAVPACNPGVSLGPLDITCLQEQQPLPAETWNWRRLLSQLFSGLRKHWPEFQTVWRQLTENTYTNQAALASELRRFVQAEAKERIKSVNLTKPEAYGIMWKKLEACYDDTSASAQSALYDLSKLKPVKDGNCKGLCISLMKLRVLMCSWRR